MDFSVCNKGIVAHVLKITIYKADVRPTELQSLNVFH